MAQMPILEAIQSRRFAEMETKLGEIDRGRAIYSHASQMCDPRVTADFWQVTIVLVLVLTVLVLAVLTVMLQVWKDFEVKHGNEDTLREMLRIKRSVQAVYNTQVTGLLDTVRNNCMQIYAVVNSWCT